MSDGFDFEKQKIREILVKHPGLYLSKIAEVRTQICALIEENPGINLTSIAELLGMRVSLAEYHLLSLEKTGAVVVEKGGGKRFYLGSTDLRPDERRLLGLLRQEI